MIAFLLALLCGIERPQYLPAIRAEVKVITRSGFGFETKWVTFRNKAEAEHLVGYKLHAYSPPVALRVDDDQLLLKVARQFRGSILYIPKGKP